MSISAPCHVINLATAVSSCRVLWSQVGIVSILVLLSTSSISSLLPVPSNPRLVVMFPRLSLRFALGSIPPVVRRVKRGEQGADGTGDLG